MVLSRTCRTTIAGLVALAGVLQAQQKTSFDPTRDLPGYEETRSSRVKDLFPVDAYADMLGVEMDAAELAAVQVKWREDCTAVQKHLDELRTNPSAGLRWVLETRMARHKFFSKVTFAFDASAPPFLLLVQKPSFDDPNYATSIVQLFTPYLTKLAASFDKHVVQPTGAKRRPECPLTPIVVLASPGDFENYYRLGGVHTTLTRGAEYDEKLDLVIVAVNSFDKPKATPNVIHPLLREALLAMLRAHASTPSADIESMWLREGLAGAFSWPRAGKAEALDDPAPRKEDLKLLVETCHQPAGRKWYLHPVGSLASISAWPGLYTRAFGATTPKGASTSKLAEVFMAQSALWIHYLAIAGPVVHRDRFRAYLEAAMTGGSGTDALAFAFVDTKLSLLDQEFWSWVYDEHARQLPDAPLDRNDLAGLFAPEPKPSVDPADPASSGAAAAAQTQEPPFDPATLALGEVDFESRHGLALQLALSGDFTAARTLLEEIAKAGPPAPDDGRIARDLHRVNAAIALRDGLVNTLIAKGGRLAIEIDGKKVNAPVVSVKDGSIVFGENGFGAKSLPLSALNPLELVRQTEKKEFQAAAPPWTRAWLLLLAGDPKWERNLKTDSPEAKDLKEDGTIWYRNRLQNGVAASLVDRLAKASIPTTRSEAEPVLACIRELMTAHAQVRCVLLRKDRLARFSRESLDVLAADANPGEFVRGKLSTGEGGTTTLVYDFDSADEIDDFVIAKGHMLEWRKSFPCGSVPESESSIHVEDGAAEFRGNAFWRLPIGFEAPFTLRLEYTYRTVEGQVQRPPNIAVQVCDDGKRSYIHVDSWGGITVTDSHSGAYGTSPAKSTTYFPDTKYVLELAHDGKHVSTKLDGEDVTKSEAGPRLAGDVAVLVVSEGLVAVHRLEITGRIDGTSLSRARVAWVARSLADMGF